MFRVAASLVIARSASGEQLYLYQGAIVPDGLAEGELDRLVRDGFFVDLDPAPTKPARQPKAAPASE